MMQKDNFMVYCEGIEENIKSVVSAMDSGVVLTRREEFDFLFKCYVAGKKKESKLTKLSKEDKALAKLYAKYFLKTTMWYDEDYSFNKVKKFVSSLLIDSYIGEISNGLYRSKVFDVNGVLHIRLLKGFKGLYEFKISETDDLVLASVALTSYIGAELEIDEGDKEFMSDYLFIEMRRYENRIPSRVYVDKRKHSLSDVITKKVKKASSNEKVLKFKVG